MDLRNKPIDDCESLFRADKAKDRWENGRPLPALFKGEIRNGVSVQRNAKGHYAELEDAEIVLRLCRKLNAPDCAVVKVECGFCRSISVYPKAVRNSGDEYHAEIHNGEGDRDFVLDSSKAIQLAKHCVIVKR